jgi:hypothetical protein
MSANAEGSYFPKKISKKQATDTGMAMVLILLLIGFFTGNILYYKIAIPVLIINMVVPTFYKPVAVVWLGLSTLLGTVVSKVLLTVVYIVMVVPIGLLRRLIGKDSLHLKEFKKDEASVMKMRDYSFTAKDIERPY